ncbi:hypothetical protein [Ekhidna sp.]|uniref:hypothetical protein n=1 Tax=Ekhidna sp. TaxID=2608089 RepID=UPI003BAC81A4
MIKKNLYLRKRILVFIITIGGLGPFGFAPLCTKCQPKTNDLSPEQFANIKLNGVTLKSIWETNGNEAQVKNLLGIPLSINKEGEFTDGIISRDFYYNGLELGFYNNSKWEFGWF